MSETKQSEFPVYFSMTCVSKTFKKTVVTYVVLQVKHHFVVSTRMGSAA